MKTGKEVSIEATETGLTIEVASVSPEAEYERRKNELIERLQAGAFTLSFSSLTHFAVSPRAFIKYKLQEKKTTDAMQMGNVVHCLILEPDEFSSRYAVGPEADLTTNKGKAIFSEFLNPFMPDGWEWTRKADLLKQALQYSGIEVITRAVYEEARMRANSVMNNRAARNILNQIGETELAVEYEINGFRFKGKIDGEGASARIDLKNYPDATIRNVERDLIFGEYKMQGYCYQEARGAKPYYVLAVDGDGEVSVHGLSPHIIAKGGDHLMFLTDHFRRAIEESRVFPEVWDESQDFWLYNSNGVNYL